MMKKSYISPNIDVEYLFEETGILANSNPPRGNGDVTLGDPTNSPTDDDNRKDEGIGDKNGGEALSKNGGFLFVGEWYDE